MNIASLRYRLLASVLCALLLGVPTGHAQVKPSADACVVSVNRELAQEQRIYRTILFGHTKAKEAPLGETRYDTSGNAWIKLDVNGTVEWRSPVDTKDGRKDATMDQIDEAAPRRGIFATKQVLTSELVPPLTQSFRALRCRVAAVCEAAASRAGVTRVRTPGCNELPVDPMPACQFNETVDRGQEALMRGYCRQVASRLLDQESELLKLAVSYDAAYRSLLHFARNFDLFLTEFRVSLLTPIRQAVGLLGQLHRIPCFSAQCDQ
ncbi:hypothetical protein HYZ99_03750 [Candidatus Peregrinibacteria bacterium]|nr:hypothetical protein [Candidatus Peregrinibacteria bacterium]